MSTAQEVKDRINKKHKQVPIIPVKEVKTESKKGIVKTIKDAVKPKGKGKPKGK